MTLRGLQDARTRDDQSHTNHVTYYPAKNDYLGWQHYLGWQKRIGWYTLYIRLYKKSLKLLIFSVRVRYLLVCAAHLSITLYGNGYEYCEANKVKRSKNPKTVKQSNRAV